MKAGCSPLQALVVMGEMGESGLDLEDYEVARRWKQPSIFLSDMWALLLCITDVWVSALMVLDCVRTAPLHIQRIKQKIERFRSTYQT
jgi:hypothetical protein